MKASGFLAPVVRQFPCAVSLAVPCLALAATAVLWAGDGPALAATNGASASHAATNALRLWLDVPTNTVRSDVLSRTDLGTTNRWLPPDRGNVLATSATWRTTAEIGMGYFHARRGGWDCPGDSRRSVDGWFQEVGVGMERDLDSGVSVGLGVSVGRASVR